MRILSYLALAASCAVAGCGGGGGGGGTTPTVPLGTFNATTDRTTAAGAFSANVSGASAGGTTVLLYGDERTGPVNAYTSSNRLTVTLYGPVNAGAAYFIATSHAAGTAVATYLETANQSGSYVTTGIWTATSGTINIEVANGSHIQGTLTLTTRNAATGAVIHWTSGEFNVAYETPPPPQV
ncbi:MAG TPA: hypothetical protein VGM51_03215 [Armatimonadota bacterium]|jgi:hypothetical protein